jgi:hypothetical protein
MPLTAEDAIIMNELEWAERTMEGYRQKNGFMPIRSTIRAAHVNTEEWRRDSIDAFSRASQDYSEDAIPSGGLRGRRSSALKS